MDFLSFFIIGLAGIACIICLLGMLAEDWNRLPWLMGTFASALAFNFGLTYQPFVVARQERNRELEAHDAECRKPKLVTEMDGVRLYGYQPSCSSHMVYFSKSGAQWTEDVHHSGAKGGGWTEHVQHEIPNTEAP